MSGAGGLTYVAKRSADAELLATYPPYVSKGVAYAELLAT